jgi:hypothetical protein
VELNVKTLRQRKLLGGALLAATVAGCNNFLTGDGVDSDPNNPISATTEQLFVAAEVAQFAQQTSSVAQLTCLIVQHCGGVGNYVETWGTYGFGDVDTNVEWLQTYVGGGLLDMKEIKRRATEDNNLVLRGYTSVLEALDVSFAADQWGDVPYREAGTAQPHFDPQLQVYDDMQKLLDSALVDLGSGPGGLVRDGADLLYGDNPALWIQAAHTLKARLYVHTTEALQGGARATAYGNAITEALQGISTPANNFSTFHSSSTTERNMWYQFSLSTFGQYLTAGSALVDSMKARGESVRLPQYFTDAFPGTPGPQFEGYNAVNPDATASSVSAVANAAGETRITPTFRQPILSYDENELILAEAYFQTSNPVAAATHLNNVRAQYGLPDILPGVLTLQDIAMEEYVSYFENIEAWHSYKRFCYPNLEPAADNSSASGSIPVRVF